MIKRQIIMEKLVRVPFDVETAKKIQSGECDGRIVTRCGRAARIASFDLKDDATPIVSLIDSGHGTETCFLFHENGRFGDAGDEDLDLFLEIPEYLTFKDGDVIAFNGCDMVAILQGKCGKTESGEYFCKTYVVTNSKGKAVFLKHSIITNEARKATEQEKQKLIDALKESTEPRAKEYLKRFLGIEEKPEHKLKPFDKVLVRDFIFEKWEIDLFSHIDNDNEARPFICLNGVWKQCIPYEGNEHLLGTDNSLQ